MRTIIRFAIIASILFTVNYCYGHDSDTSYCNAKVIKKYIKNDVCYIKIKRKDDVVEKWQLPYGECVGRRMKEIPRFEECASD